MRQHNPPPRYPGKGLGEGSATSRISIRLPVYSALVLACSLAACSHAADLIGQKHLTVPEFEGEELVAVPLDTEVYARSGTNYPDLRIIHLATTQEVPYLLRRAQTKRSRKVQQVWSPEDLSVKPLDDGGLEIRFRSDLRRHPQPPQGIRFVSPLVNFEHHVRVEVSDDGIDWHTVFADGLIFDYSQFIDVRNLAIEPLDIAGETPEFYRLTIANVTQEQQSQLLQLTRSLRDEEETSRTERVTINRQPFRIDRIELWIDEVRDDVPADRQATYPLTIDRVEQDAETKQTRVYLTSQREPLAEIVVETPERNFSRSARVEAPAEQGGQPTWHTLGTGTLSRIDFRSLHRESLSLAIPETRATRYRLTIDNQDNRPIELAEVSARGQVYEVVFLADADATYALQYGDPALSTPSYDHAAIDASLREGFTPLVATLGDEELVEAAPAPAQSFFVQLANNTWAMTAIIGVLVLVLAAALIRATRQLDTFEDTNR